MSLSVNTGIHVQPVSVSVTAPGHGLTPDDLAEMMTNKIVYVGPDVPEPIRGQAHAYRDHILMVSRHYLKQAQTSDRTTVIGALEAAGMTDAANLVRGL